MSALKDIGTGFRDFLLRGNVIDLAVAVVVGGAFTVIVSALVDNLLTPLIALIVGQPSFDRLTFTINDTVFGYGAFLTAVINFILVAAALYFFVVLPVKKLSALAAARKSGTDEAEPAAPPTDEAVLLAEIRDLLKSQNTA
ncbi:MAG: large conductance mechanosensitive channel protein [Pseudonocardiales bacterium]|nr:large conductance mechanosensitive channel protein [Pseudonocardiales bacterium]